MRALNAVGRQRALYADMLEMLRRGSAEILYDSDTALLLREGSLPLYVLAAERPDEGRELIDRLPAGKLELLLRGEELVSYAREERGFDGASPFWQVLYEGGELPERGPLLIRHPDEEDFPTVARTYTGAPPEQLIHDFQRPDFLGGYVDGKLACYIGLHAEGSMGLLHVLEPYRRRGYAEQIYTRLINNQLRQGRLPYAQVFTDNGPSLALQRKLGFTFSSQRVYWLWRE